MPTIFENSYVDRLQTQGTRQDRVKKAVEDIRGTIAPLIGPDSVKILTAIATDVMTGIQSRNNRSDVNNACAALKQAIELINAVDQNLNG